MTTEVTQKNEDGLGGSENWSRRSFPKFNQLSLCSCNTCSSSPLTVNLSRNVKVVHSESQGAITVPARLGLLQQWSCGHTHSSTSSHKLRQSMFLQSNSPGSKSTTSCKISLAALSRVNSALPCTPPKSRSRSTCKACAHRRRDENPHSGHASLPLSRFPVQSEMFQPTCPRCPVHARVNALKCPYRCCDLPSARMSFALDIFPAFSPAAPLRFILWSGGMFNAMRVKSALPCSTRPSSAIPHCWLLLRLSACFRLTKIELLCAASSLAGLLKAHSQRCMRCLLMHCWIVVRCSPCPCRCCMPRKAIT